jgi:anti-sigma B factor antagonist
MRKPRESLELEASATRRGRSFPAAPGAQRSAVTRNRKNVILVAPQGGVSMALTIASREVDGVTVLDLSGRITLGEGSVQLRDAIRGLISKGQKKILLNMAEVNYIDSSGLGELVSAFTSAKNQQAEVKLLKLTKKVHDLLQLTKLYTVFDIKDDEAGAIASFN